MSMQQAVLLALRSVQRRPTFYCNIVALLALGIGVSVGTFGLIQYIVTDALPYPGGAQLIIVHDVFSRQSDRLLGVSEPELLDYRNLSRSFVGLAAIETSKSTLMIPEARRVSSASVSSNLFRILGIYPSLGRTFGPRDEDPAAPAVALVSARLFTELPGCRALANCTVTTDGITHAIVGVLPPNFRLPQDLTSAKQTDLLLPFRLRASRLDVRDNPRLTVIGRLRPTVNLVQAQEEMESIADRLRAEYSNIYTELGYLIRLQELRAAILGDASFVLLMSAIAASFLFIVALTNAGTFLLIASEKRTHGLLTAVALGAPLKTLRFQLFVEVCLLSLAAFIPGVLLGWLIFAFVANLSAGQLLPLLREAQFSPEVAVFGLLLSIMGAVIMFIISQASLSRAKNLLPAISREMRTSTATGSSVRKQTLSITVQIALSTALIAMFLLVALSQHRLQSVDLGFETHNILVSELELAKVKYRSNESVIAFFDSLLSGIRSQRGLEQSCLATSPPLVQGNELWPFEVFQADTARPSTHTTQGFAVEILSGGCLSTLGISLLDGADLPVQKSLTSVPVALVSESFARQQWPSKSAVGKLIRARLLPSAPWVTIVGVVSDVHHEGPNASTAPTVYLHYSDIPALTTASVRLMRVLTRVTTRPEGEVAEVIQQIAAHLDETVPVQVIGQLSSLLAALTAPWRFTGQVLSIASLIGPVIAISGLYSLLSALVLLRRKEIAIRIAVGAAGRDVFYLFARQTLLRVIVGGILGVCASLVLFAKLKLFLPQTVFGEAIVAACLGLFALLCVGLFASASLIPSATSQAASAYREV